MCPHTIAGFVVSIQQAIRDLCIPHQDSKVSDVVTVSMGISCLIPTVDSSVEDLIKISDDALYQAKQQGRDRYITGLKV